MRVWFSLQTNPHVSRTEVLAVFPVVARTLCGRGGRTLTGCRSQVVLFTSLVIVESKRHTDLAMVAAVLGWDHPSPSMVCARVPPVKARTRGTVSVWHCYMLVCRYARLSLACELERNLQIVSRVLCEFFGVCCSSYMTSTENDIDW